MQVKREFSNPTNIKLTITADQAVLDGIKKSALEYLSKETKVPGFRQGKAPLGLVEKNIPSARLQSEFLDRAINHLYADAIAHESIRPVAQPDITVSKFVPFTTLEFVAKVEAVGEIILADYKKIKLSPEKAEITAKEVDLVMENLRARGATKEPVTRKAKMEDEVLIDFSGVDAKTKEPINGAEGKAYPLVLGIGNFIPGFEEQLVGVVPDETKEFTLTFPKDYHVKALQNRKVDFKVAVKGISAVKKPKLDDAFAASVGPFKTVSELKKDVKKQLQAEKEREVMQAFDNELLKKISDKSTVEIPHTLIEEEIDRIEEEEKRNIAYRGQTWQEHLDEEQLTAEAHRERQREVATARVKSGLILSEIAKFEKMTISPEELEIRIQILKGQYPEKQMQSELDKPENRREILNRMLTEKTLDALHGYSMTK
jgi:trigger factor